ncbi:glycosyltransferase family 9 protein [Enterobacter vonholyi]
MSTFNEQLSTNQGSLISNNSQIVSSYDIDNGEKYTSLQKLNNRLILNNTLNKTHIELFDNKKVNIINGFGVTLGDSIIGLNVCYYLKRENKSTIINIVRPCTTSPSIEELYSIANKTGIFDTLVTMPYPLSECKGFDINIDMGNQLFRNDFQRLEMHDYFFEHMGVSSDRIPLKYKSNQWLKLIKGSKKTSKKYVLFCPEASTKIRSIPIKHHVHIIEKLRVKHNLPIYGFSPVEAPFYTNISHIVKDTATFIQTIKNSSYLYTADSSALHIAAGFDIPCHCIFTTINPDLRIKYYPYCTGSFIGDSYTTGIHFTENKRLIHHVETLFNKFYESKIY